MTLSMSQICISFASRWGFLTSNVKIHLSHKDAYLAAKQCHFYSDPTVLIIGTITVLQ